MDKYISWILLVALQLAMFDNAICQQTNCAWLSTATQTSDRQLSFARQEFERLLDITDADSLYILPVVVHVIHTGSPIGSADNPSDAAINAMITNLNNAFRRNGPSFAGADLKIQFQLAIRSASCGVTNGINRINGSSVPNYTSGGISNYNFPGSAPETAVKSLSRWPNTDYINIWIVNKINGSATAPGGYAYFPEYNSAATDGIVLLASVVDGSNKTVVHEMGHYFYLYHAFADGAAENSCAANTSCATQGDLICDTEPFLIQYNCSSVINSCSGNPYIITDLPNNYTVLNNYMGYTNCQWMFTANQKTRIRSALFSFRNGLISSGALSVPNALLPAAACIPAALFGLSPYYGIERVDFNSLYVYSNTSEADNTLYADRTCNQRTNVVKGQTYTLTVAGSYGNPHRIKAYIDYNNNGSFNDAGESLLNVVQDIATAEIIIPPNAVTDVPLRMRILADNPALPDATACQLSGTLAEGAGQVEDYAVVINKRQVISANSGPWNAPATWLCNCIPQGDDQVLVKATHTVTVTAAMGALQCGKITVENGGNFSVSGNGLSVTGKE